MGRIGYCAIWPASRRRASGTGRGAGQRSWDLVRDAAQGPAGGEPREGASGEAIGKR